MHQLGAINIILYRFIFSTNEHLGKVDIANGTLIVNGRNVWEDEEQSKGPEFLFELYAALEWVKAHKEIDPTFYAVDFVNNIERDVVFDFLVRCHESLRRYLCSRDMTKPAIETRA